MFEFRFYEIWRSAEYIDRLADGLLNSLFLSTIGGVCGFIMGLMLAIGQRKSKPLMVRLSCISYVEFVRNTPFIVQLFFVAFALPLIIGYRWSFEASALFAMTLNFSAYFAEVIRAGIDGVHSGQVEAYQSLGITRRQGFFRVMLPQALASVYPSITSQYIFLFLTTGLISEIGVRDLTWVGRFVADRTFGDFEVFILLTLLYMGSVYFFRLCFALIERRAFAWNLMR